MITNLPFTKLEPAPLFDHSQILALAEFLGRRFDASMAALMLRTLNRLKGRSLAELTDVSWKVADGLMEFLVSRVDLRLQQRYREHFRTHPPRPGMRHAERIAALAPLEAEIREIVATVDWREMAAWLGLEQGEQRCLSRLSTLGVPLTYVSLLTSYHCTASCNHCCNHSSPRRKDTRQPLSYMLAVIRQMPDFFIGRLAISGGEPFLYPEDVLAIVRTARAVGIPQIQITTNAYWAERPARARVMLERLKQAGWNAHGQDVMAASTGVAHREYVDVACLAHLAEAYQEVFGTPLKVRCELDATDEATNAPVRKRLDETNLNVLARVMFQPVVAAGRGKDFAFPPSPQVETNCRRLGVLTFSPGESVQPCCGFHDDAVGLQIRTSSHPDPDLKMIVRTLQNDPIPQFLAAHPVKDLLAQAEIAPTPIDLSDRCAPCRRVLTGLEDREALQAKLFPTQRFYPFDFTEI